ncbi:MAG: terminase small subunit [Ruminococcus sp.]|nr:terminase small subunit [Ruminococcus sp.]MCM1381895.1 terminase small subunit [Muribaculaceae bacterium]MCM1479757.1 terminase small subunit [Muribaculaceae bacterium]
MKSNCQNSTPKKLTKRQKRFLCRIAEGNGIAEAVIKCGYSAENALETGLKILGNPEAAAYLEEVRTAQRNCGDSVERGLEKLVCGKINDAVILAQSVPEEFTEADVRALDLYNVSEMKIGKGVCEIKFADRIKAAEKLNEIRIGRAADNAAQSFLDAISGEEVPQKDGD